MLLTPCPLTGAPFGGLLGAAVFPVKLILTVLAGGELLTGNINMMTMPVAWFARRISGFAVLRNWFWVTIANFIGSLAIA
nr:formate/nitrite transporter [Candidatus Pantoea persica]